MGKLILTLGAPRSESVMAKKVKKALFDSKVFLATVAGGRTISKYRTNQTIFSQGSPADAVFYGARSKLPLSPSKVRKPLLHSWGPMNSAAKDA